MKITIEKKTFNLKFGFKCFLNLGKRLKLKTFGEISEQFSSFGTTEDLTIDQLSLIESLVVAAAESHPDYKDLGYTIPEHAILDTVMQDQELLTKIFEAFIDAMPKDKGKQKPRKSRT